VTTAAGVSGAENDAVVSDPLRSAVVKLFKSERCAVASANSAARAEGPCMAIEDSDDGGAGDAVGSGWELELAT
jgi:hypothetical protein